LSDWNEFLNLGEVDQCKFLLNAAELAWKDRNEFPEIKRKINVYLSIVSEILDGDVNKLMQLMVFLEDPDMKESFAVYFDIVSENEKAAAALDLASYACGFTCRSVAKGQGIKSLPEPVIESILEIYDYYKERAEYLHI
jgi:hypothetical protein